MKDKEIEYYVEDLSEFIKDQLNHPEKIGSEESSIKLEKFYGRGRTISNRKRGLRKNVMKLRQEMYKLVGCIESDSSFQNLKNDINELVSLLILDEKGNFTFKTEILQQLKMIVLIALLQNLRFPLPKLHYDGGDKMKFTLKEVMINIQEVLPDKITAQHSGEAILDLKNIETKVTPDLDKAEEIVTLKLENMNVKIHDADIKFKRGKFPKVDDSGTATIKVGGKGMDLLLSIAVERNLGSEKIFDLKKVDCTLHELNLTLSDTKHDKLYNALLTVLKPVLKKNVENALEEKIKTVLIIINRRLVTQREILKKRLVEGAQIVKEGAESKILRKEGEPKLLIKQKKSKPKVTIEEKYLPKEEREAKISKNKGEPVIVKKKGEKKIVKETVVEPHLVKKKGEPKIVKETVVEAHLVKKEVL